MLADASTFCLFLAVADVPGCARGFFGFDSLPSVAAVKLPFAVGSFFLRGFFGAAASVVVLFLARLWVAVVAEASLSTPPPTFTLIVELSVVCLAVGIAASDGDSGDFGGDESSGEEL